MLLAQLGRYVFQEEIESLVVAQESTSSSSSTAVQSFSSRLRKTKTTFLL